MMVSTEEDGRGVPLNKSCMVNIKNAWKSYNGKDYILRDLNMTINKGKIYSLLGSSGVGKTTLLQCITGNVCLDSGEINVDITSRLQIGYMPQELALYEELTLKETFQFFGMILFMPSKEIARRVNQMTVLLDLPPQETQIINLSGGQQRRVSLAVAMLNNPQFLILDEPTVSLDTLLKQSIWEYMINLTKNEGKTILLTTHYIEEANNSDEVGFMSDGQIMLQGSPEEVKYTSNPPCERLEDVYYQLCDQQKYKNNETKPQAKDPAVKSLSRYSNFSIRRTMSFALKTVFYIRRNLLIFYVFIFSPALMTVLLSWALEKPKGIKIGYVNNESNCTDEYLNCTSPLSCRYINQLGLNDYQMVKLDSVNVGYSAIEKNQVWGMVRFNWNFSEGVINRLEYFYAARRVEISEDDEARVWLDMSAFPIGNSLKKHFYDSFLESIQDWYQDCGWNPRAAHPIIRIKDPLLGGFKNSESLISSGIPPMIVVLIFSVCILLGLLFVLTEKDLGTLKRCQVNGLKTYELLLSIFVTCFICLIPTGIFLLLLLYLYTGPANGPVFWLTLLLNLQTATGTLLGLVIGLLSNNLSDAMQLTSGFLFALTFLAGILWPAEGLHWSVKVLYKILPAAIPIRVFKTLANRGFHQDVYLGLAHSIGWIATLLISIVIILKVQDRH